MDVQHPENVCRPVLGDSLYNVIHTETGLEPGHTDFLRLAVAHISGKAERTDPTDNHVAFMDDKVTQIPRIPQIIMSYSTHG